ncbi:coiled-coil domain-containing protein 86 [Tamandua tetradactyla]|uniref:coiled-coil domain-containing protein 86 n=1 Tax=Tamandua tetradactyla TaxID=48850 RepID=UPI004053DF3B
MDTPLRRSRRLEGLKPEAPESAPSVLRARRALLAFEPHPEETRESGSPPSGRPPGLASPGCQPETSPGSPSLRQSAGLGSPRRQPEEDPGSSRRLLTTNGESSRFSQGQREADPELAQSKEESAPGSPRHRLQPGPGSPEPYPGQPAPSPEPSQPLQELTPQSPDFPCDHHQSSKPLPLGNTVTGDLGAEKPGGSSAHAPASKKLKKEEKEMVPMIPKGKPKSGRVWKDLSKKRFSQMVQDKPLRTSWQRKMEERQERKLAKDFARHLEEEKEKRRQEKKQRRAENLKRRLENERKAEIVQVIRNPTKLKRAKKKQLRSIEKRDTLALLQKQPPQRPAAKI